MATQQKVRIKIPKGFSRQIRRQIANDIVDFIRDRTAGLGQNKRNRTFAPYSQEYAEKKGSTNVDLVLTGDMLDNLKVLNERSGSVTIGYEQGYDGMGKVEGNRKGTYGNVSPVTRPRDFLGITQKDLDSILITYKSYRNETRARSEESLENQARNLSTEQANRLEQEILNG